MSKKVYFASPLFSTMERLYNAQLVGQIRERYPAFDLYVPQEQTSINDKTQYADSTKIAQYDTAALLASSVLIAVLDGATIDVGVASEIGVAYQAGIPILGLYTDSRQQGSDHPEKIAALQEIGESQFPYANLYTIGLIKLNGGLYNNEAQLLDALATYSE